uniref:Large ribosomal subunit protein uL18 C-terminal eukaryotes domain-containing protein n=3 Tax=Rhodosorus marinus TaxID=101924 RepID=A0A7S3A0Z5_9RHOD|mmetsp:Transcript_40604/g.161036  ORF Transcript_40604/g.161036 Transcript_40604/m.161036 type:complete len:298 (+) Transcript_40604:147-1040(+)|eukprot:CAMPEP_0113961498 /NCGR_PEP_ID=MMETSP0011_2-20120614/5344_1 /TAXON_ID=101924 /ORGANISM="Rhodosorus marinus" /LENGTH=297 /DNA_ID=CAMNT_0000973149 /DNA_START=109 /DNA_END=1002 /DNA_ORIENTATION=+ /assembly_acc=CAM_ASM_000156
MGYKRLVKNKAYSSRYQVKPRRRRSGKTDYYARRKLITQDKRKYNAPKYRLVVRMTNRDIITQIVAARMNGDEIITAAYAHELPKYGITVGLTNYSAAYATGLLLARRTLTKMGLADMYVGKEEADGEMYEVEADGDKRPFRVLLDVGLQSTTTGAKIFGAMKGCVDGGLDVPHNEKRFPAYTKDEGFLADELRKRIIGEHVADYMRELIEEDQDRYKQQFSKYIAAGIGPDEIEDMYLEAHKKIRENPAAFPKEKDESRTHRQWREKKITLEQRRENVKTKIASLMQAAAEEDDEE